jgi:hypothetical protein
MDRVGAGSIHADNLAVSIYGNIQPRVFKENLNSLSADGMLQRFIPGILRSDKTKLGHPVPDYMTSAAAWENTLRLVYALPVQCYRLSMEAFEAYRAFQAWYESAKRDERLLMANDTFMTAFGKLEGTAGRLILMFHLVEQPFNPVVDKAIVDKVVRLVRTYIIPAYRYALGEVGGMDSFQTWMNEYIIQHSDKTSLTLQALKHASRKQTDPANTWRHDQVVYAAMEHLEKARWVARIDDGTQEHRHYAEWAINPSVYTQFAGHRKAVILAKQRQKEQIWITCPFPVPPVYGYDPETMGDD